MAAAVAAIPATVATNSTNANVPATPRCFQCKNRDTLPVIFCSSKSCLKPFGSHKWRTAQSATRGSLESKCGTDRLAGHCVLCLDTIQNPVELTCSHTWCHLCAVDLRSNHSGKLHMTCPICTRGDKGPGIEALYDLAMQAYVRISCLVARYKYSWTDLPDSLQDEMDGVVQMFTEVSSMNMMAAHVVLGDIYTSAHGVARNDIRAIDFYTKAAAAGHVLSQYNLGVKRRDGLGCSQDYKHSVRWFEKAAKSNYPAAMCCLGQAYENGWGVNINYWKAADCMKRAAALDDTLATSNLGRLYWYGRGVRQSYAEARRCFIIAAANGDRTSVINLMNLDASIHRMCPLLGSRVVLRRQRDRTLNGKHGEAVDYGYHDGDSNDVRWYYVRLDGDLRRDVDSLLTCHPSEVEEENLYVFLSREGKSLGYLYEE